MWDDSLQLEREPQEVERARRYVAAACGEFDERFIRTATLLTSELITNAIEHGLGEITLLLAPMSAGVRVDVADKRPALMRSQGLPEIDSESGRGLLIIDTLATAWGIDPLPQGGGKTVWFVLLAES